MEHHVKDHQVKALILRRLALSALIARQCFDSLINVSVLEYHLMAVSWVNHGLGSTEHDLRIVDRRHMVVVFCQVVDEFTVSGTDLKSAVAGRDLFISEQFSHAGFVLAEFSDQILVISKSFSIATKECPGPTRPFTVHGLGSFRRGLGQVYAIDGLIQCASEFAQWMIAGDHGAAIKNRVTFASCCDQPCGGEYFQMVAHT